MAIAIVAVLRRAGLGVVLMLVMLAGAAGGETLKGVALVVGQSRYEKIGALANPANDARALDRLLTDLGFDVTTVTDADAKKLSRSLRRFAEDAEGADVALVYYSGHGIEAGGENFLVPVDADVSSLEDAGETLVPVGSFLEELQSLVPITIVLLDACRSNPFPPGAAVEVKDGEAPAPVAAAGLGAPRGAVALGAPKDATAGLGAVIGFAAAPGHVALDGDPGANSPYAAALLKHLSAGGFPFGDVMTMVTEEVYLKTGAKQVPWTNSSLRRTLSFGAPEPEEAADEAAIRGERRKLLLSISALGEADRKQVAAAAEAGGVPMDALFAMLKAVGAETPKDPDELAGLLDAQAARLKAIIAEREQLKSADPEITRLAGLAGRAVEEGALQSAIAFHEQAKARVASLTANVDDVEAQLKAKRLEFAAVFAQSARTYALAFDHKRAAADFAQAYEQAAKWDEAAALQYKLGEAEALSDLGYYRGDDAALAQAEAAFRTAEALAGAAATTDAWVTARSGLANAIWAAGERRADTGRLEEAAALITEALGRGLSSAEESRLRAELGLVLVTLGTRESGTARLDEAVAVLGKALDDGLRARDPLEWARIQNRLGHAQLVAAWRQPGAERLAAAERAFRAALEERRREKVPVEWAATMGNLAMVLWTRGEGATDPAELEEAAKLFRSALEVQTRERVPLLWAETQSNLAGVLQSLGKRQSGTQAYEEAAAAFRLAMQEITRERAPLKWAGLQDNLGLALSNLGERKSDAALVREAIEAFEAALSERRREAVPLDWAATQNNLGNAFWRLGDEASLTKAVDAFHAALQERRREVAPLDWAKTQNNLGNVLHSLATAKGSLPLLGEAAAAFRAALQETSRDADPLGWGMTQHNLGQTLLAAARLGKDRTALAEAKQAIEAARDIYLGAGQAQYAGYFETLAVELEMADLEITLAEKLKAAEAAEGVQ